MTDTNVIQLRPRAEAPVQRLSGLRKPSPEAMALANIAMSLAREDDMSAAARIRRLGQEARNAFDGGKHVHPTLKRSLASRFEMLGRLAAMLGEEAKTQGFLAHGVSAVDIAGVCETIAAEIEADLPEGA
jgi:hypothetical protein